MAARFDQTLEIGGYHLGRCAQQMLARPNSVEGGFEDARRHLSRRTGGRTEFSIDKLDPTGRFGWSNMRLGGTTFSYLNLRFRSDVQIKTFLPPSYHVVINIPLKGELHASHGGCSVSIGVGEMLVMGSSGITAKRFGGAAEVLIILVPRESLMRILATDFHVLTDGPLEFDPLTKIDLNNVPTLVHFLETVIVDLNMDAPILTESIISAHMERALHLLLLKLIPHGYSGRLQSASRSQVAPYYVRRAEAFMLSNLNKSINVDDLTAASSVSKRTLHYGFKRYRNMGPMQYLKHVRLGSARQALISARRQGGKIGQIAAGYGYDRLSHFSRDYKELFHESPSETLLGTRSKGSKVTHRAPT